MTRRDGDPARLEQEVRALAAARDRERARADALELDAERVHHLLDSLGVPRETRDGRVPVELSLLGRVELLLEDEPDA